MRKVKITCDSTCDLNQVLYADTHVVPLGVTLGDDFRRDGVDITADELLQYVSDTGELPKTSAISIGEYEGVFRSYVEQGYDVVHINISAELSSSHQNARLAGQEVGNTWVVDSRSLSSPYRMFRFRQRPQTNRINTRPSPLSNQRAFSNPVGSSAWLTRSASPLG